MISWQYFPKSDKIQIHLTQVINLFEKEKGQINSKNYQLFRVKALSFLRNGLEAINFEIKKSIDKIHVPVLFGRNKWEYRKIL